MRAAGPQPHGGTIRQRRRVHRTGAGRGAPRRFPDVSVLLAPEKDDLLIVLEEERIEARTVR
ncbi:hypothetical protein GCM10010319_07860 [Streptomyces blastmyceticus]|uniref:Uncharacterized protein n=1 Tax=Streptomyces blastmyceticus TaxID=68180 RepID=A0ABN0WE20_9ACTN